MAAIPHPVDQRAGDGEQRAEVGLDHRRPLVPRHPVEGAVARDSGVVDEDVDRSDVPLDGGRAGFSGADIADVELHHLDAGLGLERVRLLVVAGIVGDDGVAGPLQRLRDGGADAAGSARHERNSGHASSPGPVRRPFWAQPA